MKMIEPFYLFDSQDGPKTEDHMYAMTNIQLEKKKVMCMDVVFKDHEPVNNAKPAVYRYIKCTKTQKR